MRALKDYINVSDEALKSNRTKGFVKNITEESRQYVENAKKQFRVASNELETKLDFGVTNKLDLTPNITGINPEEFISSFHEAYSDLYLRAQEIAIMVQAHNTLFPDSTVSPLDEEDLSFLSNENEEGVEIE